MSTAILGLCVLALLVAGATALAAWLARRPEDLDENVERFLR